MQIYETVIVIHPRLSDPEIADFTAAAKQMITSGGGEILSEDRWGRRKLAYPINHSREGFYLYLKYQAPAELVVKMGKHFRLQENILRWLTVHAEQPRKHGPKKSAAAPAASAAAKTAAPVSLAAPGAKP